MIDNVIENILVAGTKAPSGSNSQPWKFIVKNNIVDIIAMPEKDHPILNFRNRGTWVAHGALIENIVIASRVLGKSVSIELFPDSTQPNLTARLTFNEAPRQDDALYEFITKRATNRKAYDKKALNSIQKNQIYDCAKNFPGIIFELVEDEKTLIKLGNASSMNEVVMLENKTLHNLFISEIAWTKDEEKKRGGGLLLESMELKPPQRFVLGHLLRYWNIMKVMNKIKFGRVVASENAAVYASAGAMGAIIVSDDDKAFINAGRMMERIWLEATRLGLKFQLLTGVLFMHQRLSSGDSFGLSDEQIKIVNDAHDDISSAFSAKGEIALLFRMGEGEDPTAYSIKNLPFIIE